MLASISKTPELELDEKESEKLAKASYTVIRHYVALDVSEKAADWMNLFLAVGGIYGPRIVAHKIRRQNERSVKTAPRATEARPAPPAPSVGGTVVTFPQAGGDFGGTPGGGGLN